LFPDDWGDLLRFPLFLCPESSGTDEGYGQGLTDTADQLYMKQKQMKKGVR
jgi:hypothetical protein